MKPKEQSKPIEYKSNNQSKAAIIFNDLIKKRKEIMNELHNSVDYKKLNFKCVDSEKNKDVSFYEYMDSKELFDRIKNSKIKVSEAKNKKKEFLNKLSNIKIGKKKSQTKRSDQ